jgi:menaquinone-dependent protoporphyrinogen oxidase
MPRVMVVHASRHGATAEIADRIAAVLRERGIQAVGAAAAEAWDPSTADAVVIGSAAYMGKWLDEATEFVRANRDALRARPTWLFSSGPVGSATVDKDGHDLLAPPTFLRNLAESVGARGVKVFMGRWDPSDPPASTAERLFRLLPISKGLLPIGDYRDWDAIEEWARTIADDLVGAAQPVKAGAPAPIA